MKLQFIHDQAIGIDKPAVYLCKNSLTGTHRNEIRRRSIGVADDGQGCINLGQFIKRSIRIPVHLDNGTPLKLRQYRIQ